MAQEEINYTKEILKSDWNLGFIGVMSFLMLVVNFWGFLPLLLAGEIAALFIAQNLRVQRIIRARLNKDQQLEIESAEDVIVKTLPPTYQNDFLSLRRLSDEIERRTEQLGDHTANALLSGVIEKLVALRYDYARMLQAHHWLSVRNYRDIEAGLTREIAQAERAVGNETATNVRHALAQNLHVLQQRLARVRKLDELVRLLEARLQVIRNSLGLVQDEIYTFTDVAGISGLVDNLLTNLRLSDEFRSTYEDVLSAETGISTLPDLDTTVGASTYAAALPEPEPEPPAARRGRERVRRVK